MQCAHLSRVYGSQAANSIPLVLATGAGGCPVDETSYYILSHSWRTAAACTVVLQSCSANSQNLPYLGIGKHIWCIFNTNHVLTCAMHTAGIIRRICNSSGQWEEPDVSECQHFNFPELRRGVSLIKTSHLLYCIILGVPVLGGTDFLSIPLHM